MAGKLGSAVAIGLAAKSLADRRKKKTVAQKAYAMTLAHKKAISKGLKAYHRAKK
jgi:hypothetical protein